MDLQSALLVSSFVLKYTLRFPKSYSMELVELEEHEGSKPLGCRIENLMEIRSGCTAVNFWVNVAHTD